MRTKWWSTETKDFSALLYAHLEATTLANMLVAIQHIAMRVHRALLLICVLCVCLWVECCIRLLWQTDTFHSYFTLTNESRVTLVAISFILRYIFFSLSFQCNNNHGVSNSNHNGCSLCYCFFFMLVVAFFSLSPCLFVWISSISTNYYFFVSAVSSSVSVFRCLPCNPQEMSTFLLVLHSSNKPQVQICSAFNHCVYNF